MINMKHISQAHFVASDSVDVKIFSPILISHLQEPKRPINLTSI